MQFVRATAAAVSLAIFTFVAHVLNSIFNHTRSGPYNKNVALCVFVLTLLLLYGLPLFDALFTEKLNRTKRRWAFDVCIVAVWVLIFYKWSDIWFYIRGLLPASLVYGDTADIVAFFFSYVAMVIGDSSMLNRCMNCWREKQIVGALVNLGGILCTARMIFIASWMILYLE